MDVDGRPQMNQLRQLREPDTIAAASDLGPRKLRLRRDERLSAWSCACVRGPTPRLAVRLSAHT